jgi:hypothetical protein
MEVDSDVTVPSKRRPEEGAETGPPGQPPSRPQEVGARPADSGTSSDKRQRTAEQLAAGGGGGDDAASSLLPLRPLTEQAASRLQRLGSPELEQEEEAEALTAWLQAPLPITAREQEQEAAQHRLVWDSSAAAEALGPGTAARLADQLYDLNLAADGVGIGDDAGGTPMDADSAAAAAPVAGPGSPQAAAVAAAAGSGDPPQRQGEASGSPRQALISRLAEADAAAPIQLLPLEALDKEPLLHEFQRQRAAAARAEQTAKAVAAAAALRGRLAELEGMEAEEGEEDEVVFLPGP